MFIRGDGYAVCTAAYEDAPVNFTLFHGLSYRMREIGIIHGIGAVGSEIPYGITCTFQEI